MDQAEKLREMVKNAGKKAKIITVTSGKGGVGKSSVSINLAIEFRKQGKNVIIFDADFGLANIEVMFGAIPKFNLSDIVYKGKELKDIIVKGPMDIGFISGGSGVSGFGDLSKDQVVYLVYKLKELEDMADIIIIDTGAGIASTVMDFVVVSDEVLVVVTPEPTSITDAYSLMKALSRHEDFNKVNTNINIITNRVKNREEGINIFNKLNVVVSKFLNTEMKYAGMVENDDNMSKAIIQQKPISMAYPNSKASHNFKKIAENIINKDNPDFNGNYNDDSKNQKGLSLFFLRKFKKDKGG